MDKLKYYATALSDNMSETPEGFLICHNVPIARTGEMLYGANEVPIEGNEDGIVKVYRDDELFTPESLASFEGKPVTVGHPQDDVTPDNWSQLAKGVVQNVRRGEGEESDKMIADLLITDAYAINLVKNGLREVSNGYDAQYTDNGDGTGNQSTIRGNHVALVSKGRCGSACAVKDSNFQQGEKMSVLQKLKAKFIDAFEEVEKEEGESTDDKVVADAEVVPEQAEPTIIATLNTRLDKIEAYLAKLMPLEAEEHGEALDEKPAMCEDKVTDADTISRAEILAPSVAKVGDIKRKALDEAYKTEDGKKVIDSLLCGKTLDSADKDLLFVSASELLKVHRQGAFIAKTTDTLTVDAIVTPESLNDKYAQYWKGK